MNPQTQNLASSIQAHPAYTELKAAMFEQVAVWSYADPSNAFGQYMGVKRFFESLEEWAKEGTAKKLKEAAVKAGEIPPPDQDPDLV